MSPLVVSFPGVIRETKKNSRDLHTIPGFFFPDKSVKPHPCHYLYLIIITSLTLRPRSHASCLKSGDQA